MMRRNVDAKIQFRNESLKEGIPLYAALKEVNSNNIVPRGILQTSKKNAQRMPRIVESNMGGAQERQDERNRTQGRSLKVRRSSQIITVLSLCYYWVTTGLLHVVN